MKLGLLKRYFYIAFIVATFLGTFHQHNDFLQHSDCQVCSIESNIADGDTPVQTIYFTKLDIPLEAILLEPSNLHPNQQANLLNARAPPKLV